VATYTEHRHLSQDGLSLYYRAYGDPLAAATPILCLPGLTRNSKDFHRLARRLSPARRIVCPDYRGRGRSDYATDPKSYHPVVHINDIRHLMAVEGLHHVVVIGTSFGGFLAMGMALAVPSVLRAVVLNDVGPEVSEAGLSRIMDYVGRDNPQPDWASAVAETKRLFATLSLKTDEEWLGSARATWREGEDGLLHFDWDTRLAGAVSRARRELDSWSLFRGISRIPVLTVRGELSDVLSPDTMQHMAREHPDLIFVTVPGCGHPPSLSEAIAVEALDDFLSGY